MRRSPRRRSAGPSTRRTPAGELLLAAGRADPAPATTRARALAPAVDWPELLGLAARHGMVPMTHRALATWGVQPPEPASNELRAAHLVVTRRNRVLTTELVRLLGRFTEAGLRPLPFKGPDLAVRGYGDLALRQFGDVDVMVRLDELDAAQSLLVADGYRLAPGHVRRPTTVSMVDPTGEVAVDLGARLSHLDPGFLWEGAVTVPLLGHDVPAIAPAPLYVALCVHGSKHFWENLQWVCDIARAHATLGPEGEARAAALAADLGVARVVHVATALAHRLLDEPAGGPLLAASESDRAARRVAATVARGVLDAPDPTRLVLRRCRYSVEVAEGLVAKRDAMRGRVRTQLAQRRRRRASTGPGRDAPAGRAA